ncbi:HlyD family efflux transporter periplasmic adaptor subunit [Sutterella sp.]|uniref:HlyD family efflux transporter periplasmic adaptor subunit n=1 Tax=Sutterella sp. TaxID=1981025 RepID=UPI0026DF5021|nr:HlyD family efflux transporter periplasmic adaptor subunit [Sutterella sp.]MDO5532654.1 biotin/lipoyl-binding protein [Sutterella sp.]
MKAKKIVALLAVAAVAGGAWYGLEIWQTMQTPKITTAWGSVDVREVSLAFETSGRIATLEREEGDAVKPGDVLGRLDTELAEIQLRQAEANVRQLEAAWRLEAEGFRREEIETARANVVKLERDLSLAQIKERRQRELYRANVGTKDSLDDAEWTRKALEASLAASKAELERLETGNRPDEIAAAAASRDAGVAAADQLRYQINKASVITSPVTGFVRSRLCEPGDMASSSRTVYEISVTSPKWVRAYVSEAQLGVVQVGAPALILTDTMGSVEATVGSVSSEAEFTPKTVQTEELRTALVYEVRLIVNDPENRLKLGQPVTVDFANGAEARTN